jgi:hypothetical protein
MDEAQLEDQIHQLEVTNEFLIAAAETMAQIHQLKETNEFLTVAAETMARGTAFGRIPQDQFDELKLVVESSVSDAPTTITGPYQQFDFEKGSFENLSAMKYLAKAAEVTFGTYLGRTCEVELQQVSKLSATPGNQTKQMWHADALPFKSLVSIVHLSPGNNCSYVVPLGYYGPDFTPLEREALLKQKFDGTLSQRSQKKIRERYGHLLTASPQEYEDIQVGRRCMEPGEYQNFRCDLLHAGPETVAQRDVIFVCWKVKGEDAVFEEDTQYRLPDLAKLAGYTDQKCAAIRRIWKNEGYFHV